MKTLLWLVLVAATPAAADIILDRNWQQNQSITIGCSYPAPGCVTVASDPSQFIDGNHFYNYQGVAHNIEPLPAAWTVSAMLDVTPSMVSTSGPLRSAHLWATPQIAVPLICGLGDSTPYVPVIGINNDDPADPCQTASAQRTSRWEVWSFDLRSWQPAGPAPTSAAHVLSISVDDSTLSYSVDGVPVWSEDSAPAAAPLDRIALTNYNFGTSAYSVDWSNIAVAPEPSAFGLAAVALALLMLSRITHHEGTNDTKQNAL